MGKKDGGGLEEPCLSARSSDPRSVLCLREILPTLTGPQGHQPRPKDPASFSWTTHWPLEELGWLEPERDDTTWMNGVSGEGF